MTYTATSQTSAVHHHGIRYRLVGLFAILVLLLPLAAFAQPATKDFPSRSDLPWLADKEFMAGEVERRATVLKALDEGPLEKALDRVWVFEYLLPIGDGRKLFVTESFSLRSWLRPHHRAVLFLSGSVFYGNHWSIPVEGYNGTEMAAKRGFFAFTVDYLGSGQSTIPEDGSSIEFKTHVESIRSLLPYIRFFRGVQKVDLVGEGYGGGIATELADDPIRVRSVTQASNLYREVQGGPLTNPGFIDFLASAPNGYFFSDPAGSLIFSVDAPAGVRDYVLATQGGFFPVITFLAATERPFYDPTQARVPGLVIFGDRDFIAVRSDLEAMVEDWGAEATLVSNELAGHAPRIESPENAAWFWEQVFNFID